MNANGSGWTRLTNRQANDFYPALSPDGSSVVYVSNRSGRFEIILRSLASSVERKLTDGLGEVTAPQISPDGGWVVFTNRLGGAAPSIWKMQVHGSLPRPLGDDQGSKFDPIWSPDGEQIAFTMDRGGYFELYIMDAEGKEPHKVYDGIAQIGGLGSWSPDGRSLAFYAGPRGDRDIYLLEIASGRVKRITFGGNNSGPCFSPDGAWLAFSSSRDGDHEIFVMRVDGSEVTQLTDNRYDDWQPNWGP
jgi:TolB protein